MKNLFKKLLGLSLALTLPMSASAMSIRGGGSDGGGNIYKGKPLESYAKNPVTLAAFRSLIAPILKDIESKEDTDNKLDVLKRMILSVFAQKTWYFVPGPLDQIPAELLNSAVRTDQGALQGFDRVWIDEDIWNSMAEADQARLMLHEAFMGLKILQFAGPFRLCQAAFDPSYDCSQEDRRDGVIRLGPGDYNDVQKMTIRVSVDYSSMTAKDWTKLIQQSNIKFPYDWFDEPVYVTPAELSQLLIQSTVSGFLPTVGYNLRSFDTPAHPPINSQQELYDYLQKNKEKCQIQAEVQGQSLHLKMTGASDHFDEVIPLDQKIESRFIDLYHENKSLQGVGLSYMPGGIRPGGGYTYYIVWLLFDSYQLSHVQIQEMVCVDKECRTSPNIDVQGGMLYICSSNSELYKPAAP